jgi:hypothetical protein
MKGKELIAVLEVMDKERPVISTVEPGKRVRGVGTTTIDDEQVTVLR